MDKIGQMTWRPNGISSVGVLHLRMTPHEPWRPYTEFPDYRQPDLPASSEGYATFIALMRANWKHV